MIAPFFSKVETEQLQRELETAASYARAAAHKARRDTFAGMAMSGILAGNIKCEDLGVAKTAVQGADALIAALDAKTPEAPGGEAMRDDIADILNARFNKHTDLGFRKSANHAQCRDLADALMERFIILERETVA